MLRRSTRPTLDRQLPDEAHALALEVSRAAEESVDRAIGARRWLAENAEAIAAYNRMIATEGAPLAGFRKF